MLKFSNFLCTYVLACPSVSSTLVCPSQPLSLWAVPLCVCLLFLLKYLSYSLSFQERKDQDTIEQNKTWQGRWQDNTRQGKGKRREEEMKRRQHLIEADPEPVGLEGAENETKRREWLEGIISSKKEKRWQEGRRRMRSGGGRLIGVQKA